MEWSEIISLAAFILALVVAFRQIQVMRQEMRPYLSFSGLSEIFKVSKETGSASMDFNLNFENVGKCVLRYEVIQFDIFINGVQLLPVDTKNTGAIVGVNSKTVYNKFYTKIRQFPPNLAPEKYIPPNYKVIFSIEYYRIDKPKKTYKLFYEVSKEFDSGLSREFFGKSFAN